MEIGNDLMTSTKTQHVARWSPDAAADGQGAWRVSWLPLRLLTQDQAVTALSMAEQVAEGHARIGDPAWPQFETWAKELHVDPGGAVARIKAR
jgi:hypothetical protein